jgi:hypothetical protein
MINKQYTTQNEAYNSGVDSIAYPGVDPTITQHTWHLPQDKSEIRKIYFDPQTIDFAKGACEGDLEIVIKLLEGGLKV